MWADTVFFYGRKKSSTELDGRIDIIRLDFSWIIIFFVEWDLLFWLVIKYNFLTTWNYRFSILMQPVSMWFHSVFPAPLLLILSGQISSLLLSPSSSVFFIHHLLPPPLPSSHWKCWYLISTQDVALNSLETILSDSIQSNSDFLLTFNLLLPLPPSFDPPLSLFLNREMLIWINLFIIIVCPLVIQTVRLIIFNHDICWPRACAEKDSKIMVIHLVRWVS